MSASSSSSAENLTAHESGRNEQQQRAQQPSPSASENSTGGSGHEDEVHLIVGGRDFRVPRDLLLRKPNTMLGRMFQDSNRSVWEGKGPYRFPDRSADAFEHVLDFYRGQALWQPEHNPQFYGDCDFWLVQPELPALIAEGTFLGLPAEEYIGKLAADLVQTLKGSIELIAQSPTGVVPLLVPTFPLPVIRGLKRWEAWYEGRRADFDRHSPNGCADCAAVINGGPIVYNNLCKGLTHIATSDAANFNVSSDDVSQVIQHLILPLYTAEIRLTQDNPVATVAPVMARAWKNVNAFVNSANFLASNTLFRHKVAVGLAHQGVSAAIAAQPVYVSDKLGWVWSSNVFRGLPGSFVPGSNHPVPNPYVTAWHADPPVTAYHSHSRQLRAEWKYPGEICNAFAFTLLELKAAQ